MSLFFVFTKTKISNGDGVWLWCWLTAVGSQLQKVINQREKFFVFSCISAICSAGAQFLCFVALEMKCFTSQSDCRGEIMREIFVHSVLALSQKWTSEAMWGGGKIAKSDSLRQKQNELEKWKWDRQRSRSQMEELMEMKRNIVAAFSHQSWTSRTQTAKQELVDWDSSHTLIIKIRQIHVSHHNSVEERKL